MIKIPNMVLAKSARIQLTAIKHAPNALFIGGVLGSIASTVLACRATLKIVPVVNAATARVEDVKMCDDADHRKELAKTYGAFAFDVAKLYGPAVILGASSVCMLTKSHTLLTGRVEALTAAYAVAQESLDAYRASVDNAVGEAQAQEIRKTATENQVTARGKLSTYARCFDEQTPYFTKHAASNMNVLIAQLNFANVKFNAQGYLFLNDVYEALGFQKTAAGQVVGWVKSLHPGHDNFIDFGIWNAVNADMLEPRIWLDFNVDGVVLDLVKWER